MLRRALGGSDEYVLWYTDSRGLCSGGHSMLCRRSERARTLMAGDVLHLSLLMHGIGADHKRTLTESGGPGGGKERLASAYSKVASDDDDSMF